MRPPKSHIQEIIEAEIATFRKADRQDQKEHIAITQQQRLLSVDPCRILVENVGVFDDRETRPR